MEYAAATIIKMSFIINFITIINPVIIIIKFMIIIIIKFINLLIIS